MAKRPKNMLGALLPPEVRRLQKAARPLVGRDKRKKPRITIQELNRMGVAALKQKGVTVEQIKRPDTRGGFEKVLDWLDLPRNLVAQAVGRLAGVDVSKIKQRGAFGLKRIYMSDVLKRLGVQNRAVRGVVGFIGDLAIDPLLYYSAGALTGKLISKAVPRVLKPAQRAVSTLAKTGRAGPTLTKGLGGQRTLRALRAVKAKPGRIYDLLARNAAKPGPVGDAARAWFMKKGYSLPGRPLFRVPFTQVMGPTIKAGYRAKAFKAMTLTGPEVQQMRRLTTLRKLERVGLASRELARRYKTALPAKKPGIARKLRVLRPQARELAEEVGIEKFRRAPGKLGQLARAERIRLVAAPTAPSVLRMAAKEAGKGRHLQELSILHRMGLGSSAAAQRGFRAVRPEIDRVAGIVAKDLGKKAPEVRTAIYNIIDVGGKRGIKRFMEAGRFTDAARTQWPQLAPIAEHKQTRDFMARFYRTMRGLRGEELKRGVEVGREAFYMPRPLTKEAAKLTRQYEVAGARALRAGIAQPFAPRTRLMPVFNRAGQQIDTILSTSLKPGTIQVAGKRVKSLIPRDIELATRWREAGLRVTEEAYPVSALELTKRAKEGRLAGILGPGVRPKTFIEMDPAVAAAQRASQHVRRLAFRDLELLVSKSGVPVTSTAQLTPGMAIPVSRVGANHPLANVLPARIFSGRMSYPEPVAKMLDRMYKIWTPNSAELSGVVRASEFTLQWFKRWALFHPAYVIRNAFQNSYGTFMAGGNPLRSARLAGGKDVAAIFRAIETGAGDPVQQFLIATGQKGVPALTGTMRIAGKDVPLALLARDAAMYNFAGGARSAAEFAPTMLRAEGAARGAARGVVSAGQRFGDFVRVKNAALEGRMKIGAWINFMEKGMSPRQAAFQTLLAMPDLSDLPLWGRRYATRVFPWFRWCMPDDHRILTRRGWKFVDEVRVGEDVLTYSMERDVSEWQPLRHISTFDHNGVLMTLNGKKGTDFQFTADHRWPVFHNTTKDGADVYNLRKVVKGYQLHGSHRIVKSAPHTFNGADTAIIPREAALIGWIFTDGHMRQRRKGKAGLYWEATIYQKKAENHAAIRSLLGEDARKEYAERRRNPRRAGTRHFRMSSALARHLASLCPDKASLPAFAMKLTKPAAQAMWRAMFAAEGSNHPRAGMKFTQNPGPVLHAFQILTVLLNRTADTADRADADNDVRCCYVSQARRWLKVHKAQGTAWYSGRVWCPTTDNGTWFVEHNGKVAVTGNSYKNGSLQLLHYLPEQPIHMASVGKLRKMMQDMSSIWRKGPPGDVPEDLRAEWMRESQAAQVMGTPDEGSAFLLRNWFPFEEVQSIAAGLADPAETARWLYGSTRPGIKFGAEMATGHDIFRNRPVRPFTTQEALGMIPQAVIGRTATPLDNLFAIRPLKEYGRRVWEQPTVTGAVTRGFLGGAIQPISAERGLQEIGQRTAGQLAILRRKIVRALENRDEPEYMSLLRQFMELQAERVRYGLQVSRSTEAVMQGVR